MSLTITELGVLFLLLFALFHWLNILTKTRAVMAFLGIVIIGTTGFLGRALGAAGNWAQHAFGTVTSWAFGTSLVAGLFIIVAIIVVHDLHPKKGASKRTGWFALALGVLVVAGVAGIPALAGIRSAVTGAVGSAMTIVQGG